MSIESKLIYGTPLASNPLVSIAIPTYKRPAFLREAIESALSQSSCSSHEVIVIDNDQSSEILDTVRCFPSSNMAVYQNRTNVGMWGNMRHALALAKGEWILILCDDDLLKQNAIWRFEKILFSHKDQNIGCLAGATELLITTERKPIRNPSQSRVRFPLADHPEGSLVRVQNQNVLSDIPKLCSSFFRRKYVTELGGWDGDYHGYADVALFLQIQRDRKLFVCDEIFGCFRVHNTNDSHPWKLWAIYPPDAASRLLSCYVDETTALGQGIRNMVERTYTAALWKSPLASKTRQAYARELLQLIVRKPTRRFLLRNTWILNIANWLYINLRPLLGQLSELILKPIPSKDLPVHRTDSR